MMLFFILAYLMNSDYTYRGGLLRSPSYASIGRFKRSSSFRGEARSVGNISEIQYRRVPSHENVPIYFYLSISGLRQYFMAWHIIDSKCFWISPVILPISFPVRGYSLVSNLNFYRHSYLPMQVWRFILSTTLDFWIINVTTSLLSLLCTHYQSYSLLAHVEILQSTRPVPCGMEISNRIILLLL